SDVRITDCADCFCYLKPPLDSVNRRGSPRLDDEKSLCLERDSSRICDGIVDCIDGRDEEELCSPQPNQNVSQRMGKALDISNESKGFFPPRIIDKFNRKDSLVIFSLLAGSGFLVLLLMIACFVIGTWKGRSKKSMVKPDPEIEETRSSTATEMTDVIYEGSRRISENRTFGNFINEKWNWNLSTLIREIGRGFYGRVFLVRDELDRFVAVKTAERDRSYESNLSKLKKRILNNEIDVLLKIRDNENIVKLLGYNRGLELIILEFCHKGSLLEFIIDHRSSYIDEIDTKTQELISDKTYYSQNPSIPEACSSLPRSLKLRSVRAASTNSEGYEEPGAVLYEKIGQGDSMLFNTRRLLKWANQIAKGMKFLESQNIIHGDLALRNVLLSRSDTNIKSLTDVEFSSIFQASEEDKMKPIPVAWMPNSLDFPYVPTHSSDVWSFGITLYEMFTLGKKPYEELSLGEVGAFLKAKKRLDLPDLAPKSFKTLIASCWNENPSLRPNFESIVQSFHILLEYSGKRRNRHRRTKFESIGEAVVRRQSGLCDFEDQDEELSELSKRYSGISTYSADGYIPMSRRGNTPPVQDYIYWKGYKIMRSHSSMT
ncbi:Vascular endothelial growth factor receptor 1like, partial [Caligus rogercresseyi]